MRGFGINEISGKRKRAFRHHGDVFTEPMFLLPVTCGWFTSFSVRRAMLRYFCFRNHYDDHHHSAGRQDGKNRWDALKNLSSPRAVVIREGRRFPVAGRDLVPMIWYFLRKGGSPRMVIIAVGDECFD